jgi:hypothetical protein
MFEASVDGKPYDPVRWGAYYKPYGVEVPASAQRSAETETASAPAQVADSTPPFDVDEEPAPASAPIQAPAPSASKVNANDILAQIRARNNRQ